MSTRSSGRTNHRANGQSSGRSKRIEGNGRLSHPAHARPGRKKSPIRLLPSIHSEQAREALLRAFAGTKSDWLDVDYSGQDVHLSLFGRGLPLLAGLWETAVSFDGRDVDCHGTWEAACWNADEDADYLELVLETKSGGTTSGVRIERQFLLPRKGHIAFLADSVIAPAAGPLTYRCRLPLLQGLRASGDPATNAAILRGRAGFARVFPLALGTERSQPSSGQLNSVKGALELSQETIGRALYAPLAIDWSPQRRNAPCLWRSLTVSELRRPVAADVAAGFRLQVGSAQWLVYHSLQNTGEARTVLGHHTWHETVIGTFSRSGAVDPLIQIESSAESQEPSGE